MSADHRSVALLLVLALAACEESGGADCTKAMAEGAPPAEAQVVALSAAQRAQLCDFLACQNGGYGRQHACSAGQSVMFANSREQCLAQFPSNRSCRATVGDMMGCFAAVKANPCVSTLFGSSCSAVTDFDCATFTPGAVVGMSFAR